MKMKRRKRRWWCRGERGGRRRVEEEKEKKKGMFPLDSKTEEAGDPRGERSEGRREGRKIRR